IAMVSPLAGCCTKFLIDESGRVMSSKTKPLSDVVERVENAVVRGNQMTICFEARLANSSKLQRYELTLMIPPSGRHNWECFGVGRSQIREGWHGDEI